MTAAINSPAPISIGSSEPRFIPLVALETVLLYTISYVALEPESRLEK